MSRALSSPVLGVFVPFFFLLVQVIGKFLKGYRKDGGKLFKFFSSSLIGNPRSGLSSFFLSPKCLKNVQDSAFQW